MSKRGVGLLLILTAAIALGALIQDFRFDRLIAAEQSAVSGQDAGGVFSLRAALHRAFRQIAEKSDNRHDDGERDRIFKGQFGEKCEGRERRENRA